MISSLLGLPVDGGPIYRETDLSQFIVEPFNTLSAVCFLLLSFYWFYKLRGKSHENKFLVSCISVLTVGSIGGIIYHAFRLHWFFMYMDWLPILILCIMASFRFTFVVTRNLMKTIFYVGLPLGFQVLFYNQVAEPERWMMNLNYGVFAALVLIPTVVLLIKNKYFQMRWIVMSTIFFILALFFRIADHWFAIPMGTHFLWHIFGLITGHCMLRFIYKLHRKRIF